LNTLVHLALIAKLRLREQCEFDRAIRPLADQCRDFLQMDVAVLRCRFQVPDLGGEVLREGPARHGGRHERGSGHGNGKVTDGFHLNSPVALIWPRLPGTCVSVKRFI
jgi:hypothetical protein